MEVILNNCLRVRLREGNGLGNKYMKGELVYSPLPVWMFTILV